MQLVMRRRTWWTLGVRCWKEEERNLPSSDEDKGDEDVAEGGRRCWQLLMSEEPLCELLLPATVVAAVVAAADAKMSPWLEIGTYQMLLMQGRLHTLLMLQLLLCRDLRG